MTQPAAAALPRRALRGLWRHPLLAPLNDAEAWGRLARAVNPVWSFTQTRARVLRTVDEAPGVLSLWLQPNARFAGFRAGQHVLLELDVAGVRQARCFSFSQAPRADGQLRLTIKRQTAGAVSVAVHALQPGDIVGLGAAQGTFAPQGDGPLLLLAAGSGITPMMALLQTLATEDARRDVVLVHAARAPADRIFAAELQALARTWPTLRLHWHLSQTDGRLDDATIARLVPDWAARETLLCGPDDFMRRIEAMHAQAGSGARLHRESFGRRAAPIDPQAAEHAIAFASSGTRFAARAGQSLLEAAEAAGLAPRFGCRRGICRTCQCRKRSGSVVNLLTGETSGPGEELIQLCIAAPLGAVELAL